VFLASIITLYFIDSYQTELKMKVVSLFTVFIISLCSSIIAAGKSFVDFEANDAAKRELVHELQHYTLFLRGLSKGGKKSKGGSFSYPSIGHGKGGNGRISFYHGWLVEGSYPSKGKKNTKSKVTSSKKQSSAKGSTSKVNSSSGSTSHQSFSW